MASRGPPGIARGICPPRAPVRAGPRRSPCTRDDAAWAPIFSRTGQVPKTRPKAAARNSANSRLSRPPTPSGQNPPPSWIFGRPFGQHGHGLGGCAMRAGPLRMPITTPDSAVALEGSTRSPPQLACAHLLNAGAALAHAQALYSSALASEERRRMPYGMRPSPSASQGSRSAAAECVASPAAPVPVRRALVKFSVASQAAASVPHSGAAAIALGSCVTAGAATAHGERARAMLHASPSACAYPRGVDASGGSADRLETTGPRSARTLARRQPPRPRARARSQRVCPIDVQGFHAHDGGRADERETLGGARHISASDRKWACVWVATPACVTIILAQGRAGPETTSPRRLCMPARDDDVRSAQRRRKMRSTGSGSALAGNF
ncbi:hypothetical protein HETIRDRAFT_430694 [Heterobasidion irregulare TC 32-1]|uniref:Uncharacterized protein n=1 Tax=Heterobasidion irregulare (strain TC 32-1) TaxID=747525 RepID=W4JQT4_HETIT|nr:uncharacterized protein HETIRDRAFT_430694 [Heterobasidion irregulare TC 32-1]ETW75251.1 hypothetical protein HETIRDRAFT_430694 [Heterobasidion irregulare TC 32-1]